MSLGVLVVDSDFIMKDGVEAHVFEAGNLLYIAEIVAIALAQRHDAALGAEQVLPEMGERTGGGGGVDDHGFRILWALRSRYIRRHRQAEDKGQEKEPRAGGHENVLEIERSRTMKGHTSPGSPSVALRPASAFVTVPKFEFSICARVLYSEPWLFEQPEVYSAARSRHGYLISHPPWRDSLAWRRTVEKEGARR